MGIHFGYVRVSTKEQNLDRQFVAIQPYVTADKYIYSDKASGKDMERDGFQNMLKAIREGDTLYVKSIDRLGRTKDGIKRYLEYFKKEGIRVKIIDLPTTMQDVPEGQDWVIDMINNIIIEVYTTLAQQERETIKIRQAEGIAVAKSKGKHLGRPQMNLNNLTKEQKQILSVHYPRWKNKEITGVAFAILLGLKKNSFYKIIKEHETKLV